MHKDTIRLRRLRPESLKRLLGGVVFLIALTMILTIWLWYELGENRQNNLAAGIHSKTTLVNARFDKFFEPVLLDLRALREMSQNGILDIGKAELANGIVRPILNKYLDEDPNGVDSNPNEGARRSRVSGFMLANELGAEFKLIYMDNEWQQVPAKPDYAPQERPWFRGAIAQEPFGSVFFTNPYKFYSTEEIGITVSSAFRNPTLHVVAIDIVLGELAEFIKNLGLGEQDRLFLERRGTISDLSPLGRLPNNEPTSQTLQNRVLEDPIILAAMAALAKTDPGASEPRSFQADKQRWWVDSTLFDYRELQGNLYLVTPERELGRQIKTYVRLLVAVSLVVLCALVGLAGVFAWLLLGQGAMLQEVLTYSGHRQDSDEQLLQAIAQGEDTGLEFKSTLRWNLKTNKPGKEIELACMKTLAAFLNTEGGTLLVGVEDDGNILGIERDSFPNEDKFLLHFNNLVRQHIGLEHAKYLLFSTKKMASGSVLVVDCQKSDKPVFLKNKEAEDFYVRVGPGTRKLSTREVLKSLHSQRWGQAGENI